MTAISVCLPISLRAAGMVVATPIASKLMPTARRRDSLNLPESRSPAESERTSGRGDEGHFWDSQDKLSHESSRR